jgi:hypothetical protein
MDPRLFMEWLDATAGSVAIRESILLYPIIETTHVLSICLFVGLIALLDLRLAGVGLRSVPVTEIVDRIQPISLIGFALMVVSGALLFYSGPLRAYTNVFFRIKMLLIAAAGINAAVFHFTVYRSVAAWDASGPIPPRAQMAGVLSLVFWSAVIICGRLQAYNWFEQR